MARQFHYGISADRRGDESFINQFDELHQKFISERIARIAKRHQATRNSQASSAGHGALVEPETLNTLFDEGMDSFMLQPIDFVNPETVADFTAYPASLLKCAEGILKIHQGGDKPSIETPKQPNKIDIQLKSLHFKAIAKQRNIAIETLSSVSDT